MNRTAAVLFVVVTSGCRKHKEPIVFDQAATPPPSASALVAAPPPSDTQAAVATPDAGIDREEARRKALQEAAEFGMLGLLSEGDAGGGSLESLFGSGDLGFDGGALVGAGGGTGEGIGLGNIGTLGHGSGGGTGGGVGYLGGHTSTVRVRQGATTVNGRLPPEVIQRIVRQHFGIFRRCYQDGLKRDPSLAGRVAIKFVVDTTGAVSRADRDPSTTLSDAAVVSCVVSGFRSLSFPQPEGGIVTVVYPLIFDPAD